MREAASVALDTREQVLRQIRSGERFAVVTHENLDGDALAAADLAQHLLACVERHRRRLPHARSRSNVSTRSARSVVES